MGFCFVPFKSVSLKTKLLTTDLFLQEQAIDENRSISG